MKVIRQSAGVNITLRYEDAEELRNVLEIALDAIWYDNTPAIDELFSELDDLLGEKHE